MPKICLHCEHFDFFVVDMGNRRIKLLDCPYCDEEHCDPRRTCGEFKRKKR